MRVVVYVEGPSDKTAMLALLAPLLEQKRKEGIAIDFFESPTGDKKASVLTKVPAKAVNIILNDLQAIVVAMPDLYPKDKVFPHETVDELVKGVSQNFDDALRSKGRRADARLKERFRVFCFKHDLESLILASEEGLKSRLGVKSLNMTWRVPVEDQNHEHPPKRVVEEPFRKHGKRYQNTVDAPLILGTSYLSRYRRSMPSML